MAALWWYMTSRRLLLEPDLSPGIVRRTQVISLSVPATMLILMVLVAVGIGRLINPLLLFAFVTLCFIVLGVLEWRKKATNQRMLKGRGQPWPTRTRRESNATSTRCRGGSRAARKRTTLSPRRLEHPGKSPACVALR